MTGRTETAARPGTGWLARLGQRRVRYLAVDGGSGAHLLAALPGRDPRLQPVYTPRHANLLLVVEPVGWKLVPALAEVARALPRPARALIVGQPGPERFPHADLARVGNLLPGTRRAPSDTPEQIVAAAIDAARGPALTVAGAPLLQPETIALPGKQEREIATELAVLSLGPIQPFTVGPLRLLLVCDGEQVLSCQTDAGYATRGIAEGMLAADWQEAAELAARLDPLAPVAGRLAYVRALEELQGWQPPDAVARLREGALAIERAQNGLWWLARFARTLAARPLADQARDLATALTGLTAGLWPGQEAEWLAPQRGVLPIAAGERAAVGGRLGRLADDVGALRERIRRDRLLAFRTRGIGVLTAARLRAVGVDGPVLAASERGAGDIESRLLTRLELATSDLRAGAELVAQEWPDTGHPGRWEGPVGDANVMVEGPRGQFGLRLGSAGRDGPVRVEWSRPSAAVLSVVPEALAGQKLADAEALLASLDLAMAEADG